MPVQATAPAAPSASAPAPALAAYGLPRRPAAPAAARPGAPFGAPGGAPAAARPAANPFAAQANRYREAELSSATPGQLVVMLFDKLQLTLRRARVALDAGRVEERTEHILKAHDMLAELRCCLDFEQGGAISVQLDALYAWGLGELIEANRRQDGAKLDGVLRMAGELREAFAGALGQLGGAATPAASMAAPMGAPTAVASAAGPTAAAVPPRQARSA